MGNIASIVADLADKWESHMTANTEGEYEAIRTCADELREAFKGIEAETGEAVAWPNSLPTWGDCALRVGNSDFIAKRVAEGGYGAEPDTLLASELHRFIYEYDDADSYRSAWFLHRLERVLDEVRASCDPEGRFEHYVACSIANSPDALRELGEYLTRVLDEDQFPRAEALLLQLATLPPSQPADKGEPVAWVRIKNDQYEVRIGGECPHNRGSGFHGPWILARRCEFAAAATLPPTPAQDSRDVGAMDTAGGFDAIENLLRERTYTQRDPDDYLPPDAIGPFGHHCNGQQFYHSQLDRDAADAIHALGVALASQIEITNTERGLAESAARKLATLTQPQGGEVAWVRIKNDQYQVQIGGNPHNRGSGHHGPWIKAGRCSYADNYAIAAAHVPSGMVTKAMRKAGRDAMYSGAWASDEDEAEAIYRAMIAAAQGDKS